MKIQLDMISEDLEQLEANIVAKYASVSQKATEKKTCSINKQIQEFASYFSSAYPKFKELFHIAHYQHGMYLAFVNVRPSDITDLADEEGLNESHRMLSELDRFLWAHLGSSIFDSLLVNLRKLTLDTSKGAAGKSISMKSIRNKIRNLHTNIKADSDEFTRFLESLDSHIQTAKSLKNLWDYTYSSVAHLNDKYEYDDSNSFIIYDLRILIGTVNNFMDDICKFYNYGESGHLRNTGYSNAVHWIRTLAFFMENS